ncbi:MAG: IS5 family transposase [DPANN group archaeon]|nr:IS5 family transposase [DPANN group archaeon]
MKRKKKYIDKRNWAEYNEELVKRGEFYINPRFLETWNEEIKQMNAGKVGEPYLYPKSMIEFLAVLSPKYDVRSLEGIMRAISKAYYNFPAISYSQINRRINGLDLTFPVENNNIVFDDVVGCDGTGIKVSNRGEWMRQKWKIRRGWIKVTMLGNKNGKIIDVSVGIETSKENSAFRRMLKIHHESIGTTYGDGTYYTKANFELCKQLKINPVFKIREDASDNANGSMFKKKFVQEYKKLGYKKWSKKNKYGNRWLCTEVIFSAVKRMEGEYVRATKKNNMFHEAKMKFWVYNKIREATRGNCVVF